MPVNQPGNAIPASHADMVNRTRTFFVPAVGGIDITTPSDYLILGTNPYGWQTVDAERCTIEGFFACPEDFVSGLSVQALVIAQGTGNCYCNLTAKYGPAADTEGAYSVSAGLSARAVAVGDRTLLANIILSSLAKSQFVSLDFTRNADNAGDTVEDIVTVMGFLVSYLADM